MLAARSRISKKKLMTYLVIIALMIGFNVYIYLSNANDESVSNVYSNGKVEDLVGGSPLASQAGATTPKEKLILENILFNKLKKIGDWPIVPQNVGKADPFAPYFAQ